MQKTTGQLIREARKKAQLTQKELAGRLNISESTLSKWENGTNSPKPDDLIRISDKLGISLKELIHEESSEDSEESSPQKLSLAGTEALSQSNDFVLRIPDKDLVTIAVMIIIAICIRPLGILIMPFVLYLEIKKKMSKLLIFATVVLTIYLFEEFWFYMGFVPWDTVVGYENI
ncbi:MAG TPA: hypothetical protein DHW39_03010 [Erysipelotrichaceae bacterium]|nr:hypothetical protein [Erysipelotrichaceae bacterium]